MWLSYLVISIHSINKSMSLHAFLAGFLASATFKGGGQGDHSPGLPPNNMVCQWRSQQLPRHSWRIFPPPGCLIFWRFFTVWSPHMYTCRRQITLTSWYSFLPLPCVTCIPLLCYTLQISLGRHCRKCTYRPRPTQALRSHMRSIIC